MCSFAFREGRGLGRSFPFCVLRPCFRSAKEVGIVPMFTDGVTAAVEQALSGVSLRQRVAANNIANANTPNFRASKVDFEADLADAIQAGDPTASAPSVVDAQTPADGTGNTVQLEQET